MGLEIRLVACIHPPAHLPPSARRLLGLVLLAGATQACGGSVESAPGCEPTDEAPSEEPEAAAAPPIEAATNDAPRRQPHCVVLTVAPEQVSVGGKVRATAHPGDPDLALSFEWSASAGTFAEPESAATSYTCTSAGPQLLTLSVPECGASFSAVVTCVD